MSYNIRMKLNIYFRKYLIHTITSPQLKKKKKFKRDMCYFLRFFIFIIIKCIWKVYLFGNILNFKIIALIKK